MANRSFNYDINMNVNKKGLDDLKSSLDAVVSKAKEFEKAMGSDSGFAEPYKEAAVAAQDLKNILNNSWNSKTNQLDFSKVKSQIESAYGSLSSFKTSLSLIGTEGQRAFSTLSTAVLNTQAPIKQTSALLDKMSVTMANTVRFGISSSIFNSLSGSISKAYNYVKKLDTSLNNIRVVSGQSADQMERFALQANAAAATLGSSTLNYTDAALIYFQQGISDVKQIQEMTDITIKMSNVTKDSAEEVSSYMTAIWNNFNDGSQTLEHYADVITALGASTASSSAEIADGLEKFASIGETVGLSYEYATSALATVVAQTRQSADTVGTAFKTLFARIEGLKLGDTLDDGTTLNKYSEALNKVGINIKDQFGELKDMDDILDEMGSKWQQLNRDQQVALAQTVAGTRQYSQLVALMDNWDVMQTNLITARNSEGSLDKQQEIYMESVDAHLEAMSTKWEALYKNLFDEDVIKGFADLLAGIATTLNTFVNGLGGGLNTLVYLTSTLSNLMSDRLAVGILRVRDNMDAAAKAAANLKVQQEFLAEFSGVDTLSLSKESVNLYARELATSEKLAQYKSQLSEKEQEALVATTERLKYLHEIEEVYKNLAYHKADAANLFTEDEVQELKSKKKYAKEKNKRVAEKEAGFKTRKSRNEYYIKDYENRITTNQNKINLNEDIMSDLKSNSWTGFTEAATLNEKQQGRLANTYQNLKKMSDSLEATEKKLVDKGTKRTRQEELILKQVSEQKVALNRQLKEIDKVTKAKGKLADIDTNEILNALQTENAYLKHNNEISRKSIDILKQNKDISKSELRDKLAMIQAEEEQKRIEREQLALKQQEQKAVSTMITLTSSMVTTLSAGYGLLKTLFNPDLSPWEKFVSILSVIATQSLQLVSTFKDFGDSAVDIVSYVVTKQKAKALEEERLAAIQAAAAEGALDAATVKKTASDAASTGVIKLKTKAEIEQAVANGTLSASNLSLSGTFGILAGAVWTALSPLLPFIAAIAAVGAVIGVAAYAAGQSEREYQSLKDSEERLGEETQKLTDSVNDLNDSWGKYIKVQDALSSCSRYTKEWNENLQAVNDTVLDILDKYPELLNIEGMVKKDANGVISLDEDKFNEFKQGKENELDLTKRANLIAKERVVQKDKERALQKNDKVITNGDIYSTISLNESQQKSLAWLSAKEYAIQLEKVAKQYYEKNQDTVGYIDYSSYLSQFKAAFADEQSTFKDTYNTLTGMDTTLSNIQTLLVPQEVSEAGSYAVEKYNEKHSESAEAKLAKNIRKYEKYGVHTVSEEGDEDAIVFMRNYVESQGGTWDASKFTNVDGDDDDRTYYYNGEKLYADDMANKIAASIQSGGYKFKDYGLEGSTDKGAKKWAESFTQEDNTKIVNDAKSDLKKAEKKLGVSDKDFLNAVLTKDTSGMTTEDIELLKDSDMQEKIKELFKDLGIKGTDEFIKAINSADMSKAAENTRKEIESIYSGGAEELDVTVSELKTFADMIKKTGTNANLTEKELAKLAIETKRYSKNLEIVGEALENNKDVLDDWKKGQKSIADPEVIKAVSELRESIKSAFGVDIDENTLKEKYDIIKKAVNGDKDALLEFQKLIGEQDLVAHFHLDGETLENAKTTVDNFLDEYKNLEIGAEITLDSSQYLQDMNAMMEASKIGAEKIQEYYNDIGYEPEIEEVKVHVESVDKEKGTFTDAEGKTHPITSEVKAGTDVTIPIVKKLTKTSPKKFKTTSVGKKGGSGGSSKKENKEMPTNEENRYQRVEEELAEISKQLSKLDKQKERLLGGKLVDNLIKQIALLNKEMDSTNEKLRIANTLKNEYADKLSSKFGTKFDSEGLMTNYTFIWNDLNDAVIAATKKYNSKKTDANDKAIEKAQKKLDEFEKLVGKYDDTIGNVIPQMEQQLEDELTKIIENKIELFDMKVNLTLELDEARKQWEEFKKNVLEDIKDGDILGNAKYTFNRYKQIMDSGQIQTYTEHLLGNISEVKKMNAGQIANIFGASHKDEKGNLVLEDNDWQKWLEDTQDSIEKLENALTELDELQETLHDNLIDSLGETKEYMDSQTTLYDAAISNLQHNLKLVQLTYGEKAYSQMSNYYSAITDTYKREYDKAVSNTAYWKQLMETYVEGTEEWEAARNNWLDSISSEQAALESYMDSVTEKYINSINEIFDNLNNKITNGKGLEYINEEWGLINQQADMYLDTIDAQFGIQQLQNKYLDAIDKTNNVEIQQKLTGLMNEQVDALKEQDKLSQYDLDRANKKYEIALKEIELQEAQMNKSTMRLKRDSQGNYTYQYAADEDKLAQLQDELSALKNELYNLDKDAYKENLNQIYSIWSEYQEKMAEAAQINDPEERLEREELLTEYYGEMINDLVGDNEELKQNLYESTYLSLVDLYGKESDAVHELEADQDATMGRMVVGWNSKLQEMADSIRDEGGFEQVYKETLEKLEAQTIQYQQVLDEVKTKLEEENAAQTNVDTTLNTLIETTDEFIQQAINSTEDIENYIKEIKGIAAAYEEVSEKAKQALIDANAFVTGVYEQNIADAPSGVNDITNKTNEQTPPSTPEPAPAPVPTPAPQSGNNSKYRLGGQVYKVKKGDTLSGIAKRYYGSGSYANYMEIARNNGISNPNKIYAGQTLKLNTGGYTGDWSGSDGRIAMLHKKELVLNANDTVNLLNTISILREMTQSMLSNRLSAGSIGGGLLGNGLEQNVHIEASFPNVTSHSEIEEALNNLVNVAAQRVQEK